MNSPSLIVRGDDFGLCHAANQAVCEAFETGILTCASLLTTTPWLAEASALAHEHPEWELGLQLMLHCPTAGYRWGPVAGMTAVPSLVEPTGTFASSLDAAARPDDILRELSAQAERAQAYGIRVAYLEYEGAEHPAVEPALHQLSERLGLPLRMTAWGAQPLLLPAPGTESLLDALRGALAAAGPGVYLWVTHPLHDTPEALTLWMQPEISRARHEETIALCSPELREFVDQRGIERISFRQHLEARLGNAAEKE